MTSCVLSLFFLAFLMSSVTVIDSTGLKVRITDRAYDVMRDLAVTYLQGIRGLQLPDFTFEKFSQQCKVKRMTLLNLAVNPNDVIITFIQNAGIQFEMRNVMFELGLERELVACLGKSFRIDTGLSAFRGTGVTIILRVRPFRNQQRHLNIEIPICDIRAENIASASSGTLGPLWNQLRLLYQYLFNNQLCPALRTNLVGIINTRLEAITMVTNVYNSPQNNLDINIDYSLSDDITVATRSLDICFRGAVFREGQAAAAMAAGVAPILEDTDLMVYVGVSEFVFNSAAMSLYQSGPFQIDIPRVEGVFGPLANWGLQSLGVSQGTAQVQLTQAPQVTINENGVSATVDISVQSGDRPALPVSCRLEMNVDFKGNRLRLVRSTPRCKMRPTSNAGKAVKRLGGNRVLQNNIENFIRSYFEDGLPVPLPQGVNFNQAQIRYYAGYLVVGGNVGLTLAGERNALLDIGR